MKNGAGLLKLNLIPSEAAPRKESAKRKQRKSRKRHRKIGRRNLRKAITDLARDPKAARKSPRSEKIPEQGWIF
ncbi:Oidioi.mRNA.OKI2018_I69.chr1.g3448.t1.cds [Oikopleura dioica]|uniref:Oidioi.mRNA.OKI2018_I69.chr1.g3448.t1.cds n=1 Tax=Oikopleura dioica TaxID=34765 RepID=A0ABN7SYG1_OIKDI|nr:Oidioi.mRNA.OKI2018_I69.chr1.g3448.t1.cds [Oikopleura dioica]